MKLLYVTLLVTGLNHLFAHAMHGGVTYEIEKVPYLAQVQNNYERGLKSVCGAAILSKLWVLSAAHCIHTGRERFLFPQVRVGTNKTLAKGKLYNISTILKHEEYSLSTRWNNDISLIKLSEPIEFNDKSQPISISKKAPRVESEITIAGYGDDKDKPVWHLKMGHQTVITRKECMKAYKNNAPQGNVTIDYRVFCTDSTYVDAGHGDSGSPAVLNGEVVGVVVEGNETPLPNIYVNVAYYYDWIVNTIDDQFDCENILS